MPHAVCAGERVRKCQACTRMLMHAALTAGNMCPCIISNAAKLLNLSRNKICSVQVRDMGWVQKALTHVVVVLQATMAGSTSNTSAWRRIALPIADSSHKIYL